MYLLLEDNRPFAVLNNLSNLDTAVKEEFNLESIEKVGFVTPDFGETKELVVLAISEDDPEEEIRYDLEITRIVSY